MKKLLKYCSFLMLICGNTHFVEAQWCAASINGGVIYPDTSVQTTPIVNNDRHYYAFYAQAGCEYTFSTCNLTSQNTFLRIYNATGSTILAENDDFCGTRAQVTVLITVSGTYTIHLSRNSNCNNLNENVSISYFKNCVFDNRECYGAERICDDTPFSSNINNFGPHQNLNETNKGCLNTYEHQSYWYYFRPIANGTINMTITTCSACDYDFAIWETGDCGNLGSPVRCSYDGSKGNTGLSPTASDVSEGSSGNLTPKFVNTLTVTQGQQYIMLIDNYTANNEAFNIDFTFSQADLLDCSVFPLPILLSSFTASPKGTTIQIDWTTATEINNHYFTLEKSVDGIQWNLLNQQNGQNISFVKKNYSYLDKFPNDGLNYYRLKQTDFDGQYSYSEIISVVANSSQAFQIFPNPIQNNEFRIQFINQIASYNLNVINSTGVSVFKGTDLNSSHMIKLDKELSPGIYQVEVIIDNQRLRKKLAVY